MSVKNSIKTKQEYLESSFLDITQFGDVDDPQPVQAAVKQQWSQLPIVSIGDIAQWRGRKDGMGLR